MSRNIMFLRLAAVLLDLLVLLFTSLAFGYLMTNVIHLLFPLSATITYLFWRILVVIVLVVFLSRDFLGSPGKLLFGLSVFREKKRKVTLLTSLLRNIPLIIPGLNLYEAYITLWKHRNRFGDLIAGTRVEEL